MIWTSKEDLGSSHEFSGNYKISFYYYCGDQPVTEGTPGAQKGYHAYFKPFGWVNWGNNIRHDLKWFATPDEAKAACGIHYAEYGDDPNSIDRIYM